METGMERLSTKYCLRIPRIQRMHWVVMALSVGLTVAAWKTAQSQNQEILESEFNREADNITELILERMVKYEDALWGGVAAIQALGGTVTHEEWVKFTRSLDLEQKYPGINGIGVIHHISPIHLPRYIEEMRKWKSDFKVYPDHTKNDYWPISYIEPYAPNAKAAGLDMAHEGNRYAGALKAMNTGKAQITGPITLVQDAEKKPGFLFFAPFYAQKHKADSKLELIGLVYAPFVVERLMKGTLEKEKRHVGIQIWDEAESLYTEFRGNEKDYDPNPLFSKEYTFNRYGRNWIFDLRSSKSFRDKANFATPQLILWGGILIDLLVLSLFIIVNRSHQRANALAEKMTLEAKIQRETAVKAAKLASMGEMAGSIAHEINNPIAILQGHTRKLRRTVEGKRSLAEIHELTAKIEDVTQRISSIVKGLKSLFRAGASDPFRPERLDEIFEIAVEFSKFRFQSANVSLSMDCDIKSEIICQKVPISQVVVNILGNACQAAQKSEDRIVNVSAMERDGHAVIEVSNSGPQISPQVRAQIFEPFFTTKGNGSGTGLGLSLSKRIVNEHKGRLYLKYPTQKTTFVIEIPLRQAEGEEILQAA